MEIHLQVIFTSQTILKKKKKLGHVAEGIASHS